MQRKMIEYLPHVLREYREMKGITDGQQWLFTLLWSEVERVFLNQFIETADEYGIGLFERILKIHTKGTDTLEERRFRVKTKWNQGQLPYTYPFLQQYLGTISTDFETQLNRDLYELYLRIRLEGYSQRDELKSVLRKMIPANIVLNMRMEIPQKVGDPPLTIAVGAGTIVRHRHKAIRIGILHMITDTPLIIAVSMGTIVKHWHKGV